VFEGHAVSRGLKLDAQRTPTAEQYRTLLEALDAAAYPVAIVGLWPSSVPMLTRGSQQRQAQPRFESLSNTGRSPSSAHTSTASNEQPTRHSTLRHRMNRLTAVATFLRVATAGS